MPLCIRAICSMAQRSTSTRTSIISEQLLEEMRELDIILELEVGVVGGEEDGVSAEGTPREKLYTTNEDLIKTARNHGARSWENGQIHARCDLRKRSRRLQARQRQTPS